MSKLIIYISVAILATTFALAIGKVSNSPWNYAVTIPFAIVTGAVGALLINLFNEES